LHPDQDEIFLKVYQGESRLVRENQRIGRDSGEGLEAPQPGQQDRGRDRGALQLST